MAWSERQQLALAIVPKVSSLFSLAGSGWILIEVLTDNNGNGSSKSGTGGIPKRRHPYHRLLLGMSVYDILESVWNFVSTWAIPVGTENVWHPRGTTATCTAQGFFLTLSVAVPIYNAFLSLYYVMVINYGMKDMKIAERAEPAMHVVAFSWAFFTALYSAVTGLLNNSNLWCWIASLPADCKDSRRYGTGPDNDNPCIRGDNAWIFRWVFYFAPLWFCIFFATVCTLMVYIKVQKYDRVTLKYRRPDLSFSFRANAASTMSSGGTGAAAGAVNHGNNLRGSTASMIPATTASNQNTHNSSMPFDMEDDDDDYESEDFCSSQIEVRSDVTKPPDSGANNNMPRPEHGVDATTKNSNKHWWNLRSLLRRWKHQRQMFREDHPRSYEVFQQSLWYLGVFYITHVWSTSNRTIQMLNNGDTYYGLIVIHSFFDPLQGFLNYLVYQRPRYLRIRAASPHLTAWQAMVKALTFSRFGGAELSNRSITRSSALRSSARRYNHNNTSSLRAAAVSRSSSSGIGRFSSGRASQEEEDYEQRNRDVVYEQRGSTVSVEDRVLQSIVEEESKDMIESRRNQKTLISQPVVASERGDDTTLNPSTEETKEEEEN